MATDFVCVIKTAGGDYTELDATVGANWTDNNKCDLTNQGNRVYSHGGITGVIADGETVTEATSGYTAVVYHCTSTQIFVNHSTDTQRFTATRVLTGGTNGGTVTVSVSDGDTANAVAAIDGEITTANVFNIGGWTTGANNKVIVRPIGASESVRMRSSDNALRYGTASGRINYSGAATAIAITANYVDVEDIDIRRTDTSTGSMAAISIDGQSAGAVLNLKRIVISCEVATASHPIIVNNANVTVYLDNCIAYSTTAHRLVQIETGTVHVRNCVLYGTRAGGVGAIQTAANATAICYATNVYGNHVSASAVYVTGAGSTLSLTTCAADNTEGTSAELDNLAAADQFIDVVLDGGEDFRINTGAALIDAGTDLSGASPPLATDIFGVTRTTNDIGASEWESSGSTCSGRAELLFPTAAGLAKVGRTVSGSVTLPSVVPSGTAKRGVPASGSVTLPSRTASGYSWCGRRVSGKVSLPSVTATGSILSAPTVLYCDDDDASAGSSNPNGILDLNPHFSCVVGAFAGSNITEVQLQVSAEGDPDFSETLSYDSSWVVLVAAKGDGERIEDQEYGAVV